MVVKKSLSFIGSFVSQCRRVWHLLRKPTAKEFKTIAKVSALGLALIGLIGFLITLIMNFI